MPVFIAKVANLIGWGEVTTRRGSGRTRNKFKLKLDGHAVTIVQRARVLRISVNAARGKLIESSTVRVAGIKTYEEGREVVDDLCDLLSFARHTRIAAYEYRFGSRRLEREIIAACNQFRPPFSGGIAKLSDFVMQTWPAYRAHKQPRALGALIHMITLTDADGTVLEEGPPQLSGRTGMDSDDVARRMANPHRDADAAVMHARSLPAAGKFTRVGRRERSLSSRLGSLYSSRLLMMIRL